MKLHGANGSIVTIKLAPFKRPGTRKSQRDMLMESMGLTKVRGAVSGKVYWE